VIKHGGCRIISLDNSAYASTQLELARDMLSLSLLFSSPKDLKSL